MNYKVGTPAYKLPNYNNLQWKNFYGYCVSNEGHITFKDSMLLRKPSIHKRGYLWAWFVIPEQGKKKLLLHRVVAELFIPNIKNKPQINHIDGNKQNNKVNNLEWATNQENRTHANKLGLTAKGNKLSKKLNEEKVAMIRKEYIPFSKDNNQYTLAEKYGVSQSMIMKIVNNKEWKL